MARPSKLASMSVEALIKMRDDIGAVLSRKADSLKKELAALGADYAEVGRIALYGKKNKTLAGRKVAPKYRDPKTGETWSGRGAPARWLTAYEKQGKKREGFLIDKSRAAASRKKSTTKRSRRKKK